MKIIWALLLLFIVSANAKFLRLCRKNTGWLECNSDETIFIDKAWYARWYEVLCNTGRWFDKHYCEGTKVDFVLQDICRGKQNCRIKATTRFLGISDPCYFSNEYLEIYYTCKRVVAPTTATTTVETTTKSTTTATKTATTTATTAGKTTGANVTITKITTKATTTLPYQEKILCEQKHSLIRCDENSTLHFITASFGRSDRNECPHGKRTNTNCNSDVLKYFYARCEKRRLCILAATVDTFGDPCPGTSKYLHLRYTCKSSVTTITTSQPTGNTSTQVKTTDAITTTTATTKPPYNTRTICQNYNAMIRCFSGLINIIGATFGRHDRTTCSKHAVEDVNTKCSANATRYANFLCYGKPLCFVQSGVAVHGDPCPGTDKYLTVKYTCEPRSKFTARPTVFIPSVRTAPVPTGNFTTPPRAICGTPATQQSRIISGKNAKRGAWPWQIALYKSTGQFVCGGSIIDPFWIVTAAHCVNNDPDPSSYYVVLGDLDRSRIEGSEVKYYLSNISIHHDYEDVFKVKHDNDIAVLNLDRPVQFSPLISPVCLSNQKTNGNLTNCYVTGWGKIKFPGHSHTFLQQASVQLVSRPVCRAKLRSSKAITGGGISDNMICADSKDGSNACQGDSGGPLVCQNSYGQWFLKGVISWGSPRCSIKDMYLVLVNVDKYLPWLKYITGV